MPKTRRDWWIFFIAISLVTIAFISGLTVGVGNHVNKMFSRQILAESRAHFQNILLTRRWNAKHGGVFVVKGPGMESNPYLENPDITTVDGVVLTKKNPALMTREISELAGETEYYQFHITSLNPLNPDNAPDAFERDALKRFEEGKSEIFEEHIADGMATARYMAPLLVEESCLPCHEKQGYRVGQIRGGISVFLDVTDFRNSLNANRTLLFTLVVVSSLSMLGLLYYFSLRLMRRLESAQKKIASLAVTDELTGIANRRSLYAIFQNVVLHNARYNHPLSVIMIDIDHFKTINDTHGHLIGDEILIHLVTVFQQTLRESDTVARFGGEEFVILLPQAGQAQATRTSERILEAVRRNPFQKNKLTVPMTVSCGVSTRNPENLSNTGVRDAMLNEADSALYVAKNSGRDMSVHFSSPA